MGNYFETYALGNKKLCHLTTASNLECECPSVKRFTVTKMEQECPHFKGCLQLYCHSDVNKLDTMDKLDTLEYILKEKGEVRTNVFIRQEMDRDPSHSYKVSIKLEGSEIEEIGNAITHLDICRYNGQKHIGSLSSGFGASDCKDLKSIHFTVETVSKRKTALRKMFKLKWIGKEKTTKNKEEKQFFLERCEHPHTCDLKIGLPKTHPNIDIPNITMIDQSIGCSSQSIGNAVLDIIQDHGYDANKNDIIDPLKNKVKENLKENKPGENCPFKNADENGEEKGAQKKQ